MRYDERLAGYVNNHLSFADEWYRIFGSALPHGNVYCPFHHNTDTPAAKAYGNGLKCFGCRRFYTVFDLLNKFDEDKLREIKTTVILPAFTQQYGMGSVPFIPRGSLNLDQDLLTLLFEIVHYGEQKK